MPFEDHLDLPVVVLNDWGDLSSDRVRSQLSSLLPSYLENRPWFPARSRRFHAVEIVEALPVEKKESYIVLVRADFRDDDPELYLLPIRFVRGERAAQLMDEMPECVVARVRGPGGEEGVLHRAMWDPTFRSALLDFIAHSRRSRGLHGEMAGVPLNTFRRLAGKEAKIDSSLQRARHGNLSIIYADKFILKMFRRAEAGIHPEVEMGRFLTEKPRFAGAPPLAGLLEYRGQGSDPMVLGVLHAVVPNQCEGWDYFVDSRTNFIEEAIARGSDLPTISELRRNALDLLEQPLPDAASTLPSTDLESARLLGGRTAEMHLALCGATDDPAFTPEPFTELYRNALYHGMSALANRTFDLLAQRVRTLPHAAQLEAEYVLANERAVREVFRPIRDRRTTALRIRHHGDFNLQHVMYTGRDFTIVDFEGERSLPLTDRRIKRSALRDVAAMLRSFQYAAYAVLLGQMPGIITRPETSGALERWAGFWYLCIGSAYLEGYLRVAGNAPFLPQTRDELRALLNAYQMEKAVEEVANELNERPEWVRIPLLGILQLLDAHRSSAA